MKTRLRVICVACVGTVLLAGCGGGSAIAAATAADAAVKPGDLPSGMVKCDGSGAIDGFLAAIKTQDPVTYRMTREDWDAAKGGGAIAAQVFLYSDSKPDCEAVHGQPSGTIGSVGTPLVESAVMQFADEASAERGYGRESILGLSSRELKDGQPVDDTDTGLGKNSAETGVSSIGLPVYAAIWQEKVFMILLLAVNIDSGQGKKIALNENARVSKLTVGSTHPGSSPNVTSRGAISAGGSVGQPIDLENGTVTVMSASLNAQGPAAKPQADAGNRYVKVAIEVVYKRTESGAFRYKLTDSSGATYDSNLYDSFLPNIPTVPGDKALTTAWFEVPLSASRLTLTVSVGDDQATVALE